MSRLDLKAYLEARRQLVDAALDAALPPEDEAPSTVHRAMRYSVLAGGKRLRPILVIAGAEAAGGDADQVMDTACALELIHTSSLIHDDLPAMDDDDYRRGRLTNHKVFGDAMAILAGDAPPPLALRLIAANAARVSDPTIVCRVVAEVADAAGTMGMVGGQVVDIESEGKTITADTLDYIHTHKTAALIRASICAGAILAGGTEAQLSALSLVGRDLGLAFQITDDILDVTATTAELGKTAGKDQAQQKATYPAVHGIEASRSRAAALVTEAQWALDRFGARAEPLCALGTFMIERKA